MNWKAGSCIVGVVLLGLCGSLFAADVILNEYNAVDDELFLEDLASDAFWGRRNGNGGDWFEVVVITDHLDMRNWEFVVSNDTGGAGQETFSLKLTYAGVWADLRSGTILTVSEDLPNNVDEYCPELGSWWINVRASPLAAGTYVTVTCIQPSCSPALVNWKVSNKNWQLTIKNAAGQVVFGPAGEGINPASGVGSTEVLKLEANPGATITPLSPYTAGSSSTFGAPNRWNGGANVQDFTALRSVVPYSPLTAVRINEVLSHSDPGIDWVELHNPTGTAVDIGRWYLSDSTSDLTLSQFPAGTTVPAHGYLVLDQNQIGFGFSSSQGDEVILSAADSGGALTGARDYAVLGPIESGVTYGRVPNGSGGIFRLSSPTQGYANAEPLVGPVIINEIMYHPPVPVPADIDPEFVELRNTSSSAVELFTDFGAGGTQPWNLSGGVTFDFSLGTAIPAEGYLLVVNFNPATDPTALARFRAIYGLSGAVAIAGPYVGTLSNFSDTIRLRKPDTPEPGFVPQVVIDEVTYFDFGDWPVSADGLGASLERRSKSQPGSLASNWAANHWNSASPGAMNSVSDEIPAVSGWALIAFTALLSACGAAVLLRRRAFGGQSGPSRG